MSFRTSNTSTVHRARFDNSVILREPRELKISEDVTQKEKNGYVFLYPKSRCLTWQSQSCQVIRAKCDLEDSNSDNSLASFHSRDSWAVIQSDIIDDSDSQNLYRKLCAIKHVLFSRSLHKQLNLSSLRVCHHRIDVTEAKILATVLSINNTVKHLDLRNNQLCCTGLDYILHALQYAPTLQYLTVSENSLGNTCGDIIRNVLANNQTLCYLNISDNGFEDTSMTNIFKAVAVNSWLRVLILSHNRFREQAGVSLQHMLTKNRTLDTLDLSWNHIRCKGALSVAAGLSRNKNLRCINLAWNGFGLEGCHEIGKALDKNHYLQELDLSSNRVSIDALRQLTKGLVHNSSLLVLKIGGNPITTDGAKEILQMVESTSIRELNMANVSVDSDFVSLLTTMKTRRSISVTYGVTLRHDDVQRGGQQIVLDTDDPMLLLFEYRRQKNLRLIDLLHAFDKDHSEDVTRNEFRDGFKSVDLPLSIRSLDILMKKLDSNRDGAVDYEELVQGQRDHNRRVAKMKQRAERMGEESDASKYDLLRATMRVRMEASSSRRGSKHEDDVGK